MKALDNLRVKSETMIAGSTKNRRPTWAPPLVLGEELYLLLLDLEWLGDNDLAVARLWARFTDPRRGAVRCDGFTLRAGQKHNGEALWYGRYFDKQGVIANIERNIESAQRPEVREQLEKYLRRTQEVAGGWSFGPRWSWSRKPGRLEKLQRSVELAQQRVMEFAGAPDEQMRAGGRFCGHCCICGKGLTDPISIELGIGPECRRDFQVAPDQAPGPLIIGGSDSDEAQS